MNKRTIELSGHIIDSLTLTKTMGIIMDKGGEFDILEIDVGRKKSDKSYAKIEVSADSPELLKSILVKNNSSFSSVDTPWAKVYRRDFLVKNNLFFNENLTNGEDGIFNYEAFLNADSIYYLNAPTYIYRINDNSVCNTFSTDLDARFIRLITEYEKMFKKYNICDENFNVFSIRILDRLLRKFYSFLSSDDFNKKIYEHYDFFEKYYKDYYSDFVTDYFKKRISLEHLKIKR